MCGQWQSGHRACRPLTVQARWPLPLARCIGSVSRPVGCNNLEFPPPRDIIKTLPFISRPVLLWRPSQPQPLHQLLKTYTSAASPTQPLPNITSLLSSAEKPITLVSSTRLGYSAYLSLVTTLPRRKQGFKAPFFSPSSVRFRPRR